jgi:hypothetical protein
LTEKIHFENASLCFDIIFATLFYYLPAHDDEEKCVLTFGADVVGVCSTFTV